VAVVYGGAGMVPQVKALRQGADVIVATPGRLLDHARHRNMRLDAVQVLVLDESDRMLDMGFMPDVRRIFELLPAERQTLMFGATLPVDIESLSARFQNRPELVEVARQMPPATLEQRLYPVGRHLKIPLLIHLLRTEPALTKVLVFAETKVETDVVDRKVGEAGIRVAAMHGDRPQKDRETALRQLKEGDLQVLVATNVAARGLDIEDLTHVVNYDMPQTVDDYVHRVGRTARGSIAEGTAYTFVAPGDETMVARIEAVLDRKLPRFLADGFDYDVPTPSWARTSSKDLARSLERPGKARFSRSFVFKRR
jgi:ATP-dependent RNA helicase RhlE